METSKSRNPVIKRKLAFLLSAALMLIAQYAHAQSGGSFFNSESGRFMQRFSWGSVNGAASYEITVEKRNESGVFVFENQTKTNITSVEIYLAPGIYRYRVRAFDDKNRAGTPTPWTQTEIKAALKPEITSVIPDPLSINTAENTSAVTLTVNGKNLLPESEIYLLAILQEDKRIESLEKILPSSWKAASNGESAELIFAAGSLKLGVYNLFIKNPGGLSAGYDNIRVEMQNVPAAKKARSFDFLFAGGWAPLLPIPGGAVNNFFEKKFVPAGIIIHTGLIGNKGATNVGGELEFNWSYIEARREGFILATQKLDVQGNVLVQRKIPPFGKKQNDRLALNIRFFGGFTLFNDVHFSFFTEEPMAIPATRTTAWSVGGAFSAQYTLRGSFFMEAGASVHYTSTDDKPASLYIRPMLLFGIQM